MATVATLGGSTAELSDEALDDLAGSLGGGLTLPEDDDYDEVRAIWNAMHDMRPALLARCTGAADVMAALEVARAADLLVAVRGGGHNIAGHALSEGGLVLDLSPMRVVRVDPERRTARVAAGALLGDVDRETQAHGLATPLGINSTTGIAGLTLGGGFGWLSRKWGLTCDNLRSADVVTADGSFLIASAEENADLFWGLRGGSGNFGVVTSFEFDLHPLGPEVLCGVVVHPQSADVLRQFRDLAAAAPDEVTAWAVLRKAPPLPFLPEEVHGTDVIVLPMLYSGDPKDGDAALAPMRSIGVPYADAVGPTPYAAFQQAFDPLLTPGARNYWKSHNLRGVSDEAIDVLVEWAAGVPTDQCEIFLNQFGGAIGRVPVEATAYPHRDVTNLVNVHTRWEDPADDARCIAWAREFFEVFKPHATGTAYVNFIPEDEPGAAERAYGPNHERMAVLKRRYDPDNRFRLNHNVPPDA
jgi:FAD/FMN-containing dehydrogenase